MLSAYDPITHRRNRSNSTDSDTNVLDLSYMDFNTNDLDHEFKNNVKTDVKHSLIRSMFLSNNLLTDLPISLKSFQNIRILDISSNQLKKLTLDIRSDLPRLKQLIANDNLLTDNSLPKDSFDNGLLSVVNFSANKFTQFPYQILEVPTLKECYLGSNQIQTLPRDYTELKNLEILYLGGNQIRNVPDELAQLTNLTNLNLSDNILTILPARLARLKRLKTLSLHGNQLTTLPVELVKLDLSELSLRNNPLVNR